MTPASSVQITTNAFIRNRLTNPIFMVTICNISKEVNIGYSLFCVFHERKYHTVVSLLPIVLIQAI